MRRQKREIKPKAQRRSGFLIRILTMVAVALAVTCCMTLFFQVEEIVVRGNHLYTQKEIADASGIGTGDNMVSIPKAKSASLIRSTLPFVSKVHIERILPGTVEITVTESDVTFAVRAQNQEWYLVNEEGTILEQISPIYAPDYPNIKGVTLSRTETGTFMGSDTQGKIVAVSLMKLLSQYGLARETKVIDVSETHNILLEYGTMYDVQLGGSENLDYKIEYLAAVLLRLESDGNTKDGVIDLSFTEENTARFDPY